MGIDQRSLAMHKQALSSLIQVAPSGFPAHGHLRQTFEILHKEHKVFQVDNAQVFTASSGAADQWRIMAKD
eukprot:1223108-Pyramimonas_sp.AAC.1